MPDLPAASADEIKALKAEKHIGSPTSILFFTQEQLRLWDQSKVLLMADYSTGCKKYFVNIAQNLLKA